MFHIIPVLTPAFAGAGSSHIKGNRDNPNGNYARFLEDHSRWTAHCLHRGRL